MDEAPAKRKYTRVDSQTKADIVLDYEGGQSIRALSDAYGVSYGAVNKLLKAEGLLRPRGVRPRPVS